MKDLSSAGMAFRQNRRNLPADLLQAARFINKSPFSAYNKGVEEITVSDEISKSAYISYLYNALAGRLTEAGGGAELFFGEERAALRIRAADGDRVREYVREKAAEVLGVGYKYEYIRGKLNVALSRREKKLLCAALIAADYEGDRAYIRRKIEKSGEICLDGVWAFRLPPLKEKWQRIVEYVPEGLSSADPTKFCEFLVGESKNKIYVKGRAVFGENFKPLRRSRLMGEEDTETEIMLSDAGYVYCLGEVEDEVGDFLQKFYAERAIFS